jgi:hypothetical protein
LSGRAVFSFSVHIENTFESPNIVLLIASGCSNCGGAYPDSFEYGMAFDSKTGARVHREDIYSHAVRGKGGTVPTAAAVAPVCYGPISLTRPQVAAYTPIKSNGTRSANRLPMVMMRPPLPR